MFNNIIANIVWLIHFVLVAVIIISPFIPVTNDVNDIKYRIKLWVLILLVFLLMQYLTGYQNCGLTEFEYMLKKENYKEGFLYRLIKPIVTMPENYFNKYLNVLHIILILVLGYQTKIIRKFK